jgi:hypothetical protein
MRTKTEDVQLTLDGLLMEQFIRDIREDRRLERRPARPVRPTKRTPLRTQPRMRTKRVEVKV